MNARSQRRQQAKSLSLLAPFVRSIQNRPTGGRSPRRTVGPVNGDIDRLAQEATLAKKYVLECSVSSAVELTFVPFLTQPDKLMLAAHALTFCLRKFRRIFSTCSPL